MKRITEMTLFALALAGLAGLAGLALPEMVKAANENIQVFDVACDCRTFASGPNRGDTFIVNGKIFPVGTLPSGNGTNDPTLPVNGVAPIGDWTCRGQNSTPFPAAVAAAYSATPFAFNTQYFTLPGRALTVEGYALADGSGERLSITGGIGGFSGAGGELQEAPFGTNVTGCPNFRATFAIQPGSVR